MQLGHEQSSVYRLSSAVQHYAWGSCRDGEQQPYIAQLLGEDAPQQQPYAELWIGAHPKLPSQVHVSAQTRQRLDQFIAANQRAVLGDKLVAAGILSLPFLLKVLSSAKPLSIQAHPDRQLAQKLHARDPQHYPDANHKPEIALSLLGLNAMCQFRELAAIEADRQRLQSLRNFFAAVTDKPSLQNAYARVFAADDDAIDAVLDALAAELMALPPARQQAPDKLFLRLLQIYAGDRGTLSAYFLNELNLDPGQAVFLGPNQPHSYLHGTIIECMANSDNVVRAGLTDKFIDQDVLLQMLSYETGMPSIILPEPGAADEVLYPVPVADFMLRRWSGAADRQVNNDGMVALLLVLAGKMTLTDANGRKFDAERGSAWLWPAATPQLQLQLTGDADVVCVQPNL